MKRRSRSSIPYLYSHTLSTDIHIHCTYRYCIICVYERYIGSWSYDITVESGNKVQEAIFKLIQLLESCLHILSAPRTSRSNPSTISLKYRYSGAHNRALEYMTSPRMVILESINLYFESC
jgi:hypothetical protein